MRLGSYQCHCCWSGCHKGEFHLLGLSPAVSQEDSTRLPQTPSFHKAVVIIQQWPVAFCDCSTDGQGWSSWSQVALRLLGPLGPQERQSTSPQVQPKGHRQGYLEELPLREPGYHFCFPEMCIWIHANTCSIQERTAEPRAVISCLCLNTEKGGWYDGTGARGRTWDAETDLSVTEAVLFPESDLGSLQDLLMLGELPRLSTPSG